MLWFLHASSFYREYQEEMSNTNDTEEWRNEWISVSQAAKEVGVNPNKFSRLIRNGILQTQNNPYDEREKLVQRVAVYNHFRKRLTQ
jgi:hypothetical protein